MSNLTWLEAGVIGLLQGVSELFPVSSLGHSVLLPALIGGSWAQDLNVAAPESPYLAFIVGTHVATALALLVFYRRDWARLLGGLARSLRRRRVEAPEERLIWLLIIGTIPVGLVGLVFEHWLRTHLGRPVPAACFLALNGLMLLWIENREGARADSRGPSDGVHADARLSRLRVPNVLVIGGSQILALAPGISRSGIATATGMRSGVSREDAVRFSFLLATPVILAAGVLKLPDLLGPLGNGIRAQVLFGSTIAGLGGYVAVRWLTRWVHTNSLRPFGIYCLVAGLGCLVWFTVR